MWYVMWPQSHASSLLIKEKEKENQKKIKRKEILNQKKIDKRKRKMLVSKHTIT